jgi:trimethylamine--corrinoid protein Co-methyltransferase
MIIQMQVLKPDHLERIHSEALQVLDRVGAMVYSEELCRLLRRQGISAEDGWVRLPPEVVNAALQTAPRGFSLVDRNGTELPLDRGQGYLYSYFNSTNVSDYGAGGLRPSTKQDVVNWVRLGDALPEIAIANGGGYVRDVPEPLQPLHTVAAIVSNKTKHNLCAPLNLQEAEIWTELDEIAREGQGQPAITSGFGMTSPLQLDEDSARILLHVVRNKIPAGVISCPVAGASSPGTLIGSLVLQTAEMLFLLTVAQLVSEGTPLLWCGGTGIMDMRTGSLSYGAVERRLIIAAVAQQAAFYGLPWKGGSLSIDAWQPDVQAGAEKMLAMLTILVHGAHSRGFVWGAAGGVATGQAVSLEQMVIDVDLMKAVQRFLRGMDTSEDAWALEVIERAGPGGNYMMNEHTLRWMRAEEVYYSDIANRQGEHGQTMLERAHAKVERVLAEHQLSVSEETVQEIERYVEDRTSSILREQ